MFKTYQGYSDLAFNVKVDGGQKRIVFDGQSKGTSIFTTRDAKLQKAIENHNWFNNKFYLTETVDEEKQKAETKKKAAAKAKKAEKEQKTYIVQDIADAKDYLADTFGVSRSKMKTKEDVLAIAKENNVTLEGLE
jgi:hypothetical protein